MTGSLAFRTAARNGSVPQLERNHHPIVGGAVESLHHPCLAPLLVAAQARLAAFGEAGADLVELARRMDRRSRAWMCSVCPRALTEDLGAVAASGRRGDEDRALRADDLDRVGGGARPCRSRQRAEDVAVGKNAACRRSGCRCRRRCWSTCSPLTRADSYPTGNRKALTQRHPTSISETPSDPACRRTFLGRRPPKPNPAFTRSFADLRTRTSSRLDVCG